MIQNKTQKTGFTLVELMLAMAFVSMLLLAIAMTVIQAGNIYNKGLALKDINQSSRLIADDMKRTVTQSGGIMLDESNYVVQTGKNAANEDVTLNGRLCLGTFSYLWNTVDGETAATPIKTASGAVISFLKVPDPGRSYCARTSGGGVKSVVSDTDLNRSVELLAKGDHSLSLTTFDVDTSSTLYDGSTGQRLFAIDYSVGTGDASAMTADRTSCLQPGEEGSDITYCNVQPFSIVLRLGGGI